MTEGEARVDPSNGISRGATRWAMSLLFAMNLLNYIDRYLLPPSLDAVARDIPMSDKERGLVLTAFVWVFMVASPVFGRLGDRATRKVLIAIGVGLWSLATGAASLAHSFAALMFARAAVGVGEAAYTTVAPSLIGDFYPARRRGVVLSLFYLAIPVGSALGYTLGGVLTKNFGWRSAFLAVGLPGLLVALLALSMREPARGQQDTVATEPAPAALPLRESLSQLWNDRRYVWAVGGYTMYLFALGGLSQWMPTYLQRVRHMDVAYAGKRFGAITALAGLVGTASGGWIAERMKGRTRDPYLWISGVSVLVAIPVSFAVFNVAVEGVLWGCIFLALTLLFMSTGPFNTVLINAVGANNRAMAFAVSILAGHALGDALSPLMIGVVSDATNLQTAMLLVPGAFVITAGCWLYAERRSVPVADTAATTRTAT